MLEALLGRGEDVHVLGARSRARPDRSAAFVDRSEFRRRKIVLSLSSAIVRACAAARLSSLLRRRALAPRRYPPYSPNRRIGHQPA